jgi:putative ABC transport system permease protein
VSGRRPVLRWAWRLFRRDWRQQALMLALVTVATAGAVAFATIAVNSASGTRGEFGDATGMVRLDGTHPDAAKAGVAAARRRFGEIEVVGHTPVAVPGSPEPLDLRTQDPKGIYGHSMLALRSGRYPAAPNEIAVTDGASDLLAVGAAPRITLGGIDRVVVGRVENPGNLRDEFVLAPPTDPTAAATVTILLRRDPRRGSGEGQATDFPLPVMTVGSTDGPVAALVLVAATLAMALVCLVAAAGFVVVAQRRQRQLGLLAATGATSQHLRLVMIANGLLVGAVAALVGAVAGIAGWVAARPAVETAAAHRIDALDLPLRLIGACLVLAVVATTAAAWWPARTVARLPVMSALSQRPARPRPVHRSLILAGGLVAAGIAGIALAHPTGTTVRPLVLIAGLISMIVGAVLASPAAVSALNRPARRLPFAPRLALRDLVRHQARAAAAVAAITLALGVAVTVVVLARVNEYRSDEGNLADTQVLIRVGDLRTAPDPTLSDDARARLDEHAARIASALGQPELMTLDVAMSAKAKDDSSLREPIPAATPIDHGFRFSDFAYVASPQLLAWNKIDPATVGADTELLTGLAGEVMLLDFTMRPDSTEGVRHVKHLELSPYTEAPTSLVTPSAIRSHGWVTARAGWFVESSKAFTTSQLAAARAAAASAGLTVEARSGQDELAALRTGATTVGGLLALAILAMTIGLIRGESARDMRTLEACGASGAARRTITATTAATLAALGIVLSFAGSYVALIAAYHADLGKLLPLPATHLLVLAIGLPVAAAGSGWLLAGRAPKVIARVALD